MFGDGSHPTTRLCAGVVDQLCRQRKPEAVLDVGTSKIVCFIASIDNTGTISVQGIGHQQAKGIRSSHITDFSEAETSINAAVHAAEQMAGINIVGVAYKGTGPAVTATMTGEVHMMFPGAPAAMPYVKQGRLRAVAVCSLEPSPFAPGVPTVIEYVAFFDSA